MNRSYGDFAEKLFLSSVSWSIADRRQNSSAYRPQSFLSYLRTSCDCTQTLLQESTQKSDSSHCSTVTLFRFSGYRWPRRKVTEEYHSLTRWKQYLTLFVFLSLAAFGIVSQCHPRNYLLRTKTLVAARVCSGVAGREKEEPLRKMLLAAERRHFPSFSNDRKKHFLVQNVEVFR